MNNYEILLNEINEFLNQAEIVSDDINMEVISLYDLYSAIKKEIDGLKKLLSSEEEFKKKLNVFRFYIFGNYDEFFIRDSYYVKFFGDENISKITFSNSETPDCDDYYSISVEKSKESDDIYVSKKLDWRNKQIHKFIKINYDLILEKLLEIEEYVDLVGGISDNNNIFKYNFSNKLFVTNIRFDKKGWVDLYNEISPDNPLSNEYDKTYLKKQSIHEFVKENEEEILKRILVSLYSLDDNLIKMYNRYKEHEREKQLQKSIKWWN